MDQNLILEIILAVGMVATIVSGIYWGSRIREAKNSEIAGKDNVIAAKDAHIAMLAKLVSPDLLAHFTQSRDLLLADTKGLKGKILSLEKDRDDHITLIGSLNQEIKELKKSGADIQIIQSKERALVASTTQLFDTNNMLGWANPITGDYFIRASYKPPQDSEES